MVFRLYDATGALVAVVGNAEIEKQDDWERNATAIVSAVNGNSVVAENATCKPALQVAAPLSAITPAAPEGQQPVQDTWFTDRALPVMAMSGDVESNRVLKLHFRRPVTDDDRKAMCDALNLHQASLTRLSEQAVTEAMVEAAWEAWQTGEPEYGPEAMKLALKAAMEAGR